MKQYTFSVWFEGGAHVLQQASCHQDAVILAIAERIKEGKRMMPVDRVKCHMEDSRTRFVRSNFMDTMLMN